MTIAAMEKVEISKTVLLSDDIMKMLGTTRISSKGQLVIPKPIRDQMDIREGDLFAIDGEGDTLVLRKILVPTKEEFAEHLKEVQRIAKERGMTRQDVLDAIQEYRRERGGGKSEGGP